MGGDVSKREREFIFGKIRAWGGKKREEETVSQALFGLLSAV